MKRFTLIITLIGIALASWAQVSFKVSAPRSVQAGERFAITYILRNADEAPSQPKVTQTPGITMLYGPSTTTSVSQVVTNGKMVSSSRIEYTYFYKAENPGKYSVGEADRKSVV